MLSVVVALIIVLALLVVAYLAFFVFLGEGSGSTGIG